MQRLQSITARKMRPSLEEYFKRARALEKSENYAGAEKAYLEAAKKYPDNLEILQRLAIVYQSGNGRPTHQTGRKSNQHRNEGNLILPYSDLTKPFLAAKSASWAAPRMFNFRIRFPR